MKTAKPFQVTILGSGTSQGIPLIGCQCEVCRSNDPKDKRLRTSIMITWGNQNFVIDTGPDFRQQMLREDVRSLRAVIYTHEHKDHTAGMDDVRAFNYLEKRDMELFCSEEVEQSLRRDFHYAFGKSLYPGVPKINLNIIENKVFQLPDGPKVIPIFAWHYKMPVFGFRIDNFTYITDVKTIPEEEMDKIKGTKILILDCLREDEHISHLSLPEALEIMEKIQPEKGYLIHISHRFSKHQDLLKKLPENVEPAYDGLKINIPF